MDSKWIAWRTAFLAAFILSMMVNINYGASLVSSLLSTPVKTIRTTGDLIDSSLQFAAEDISYSVPYFAVSNSALYPAAQLSSDTIRNLGKNIFQLQIHLILELAISLPHDTYLARWFVAISRHESFKY
jgi:hypothetical protein